MHNLVQNALRHNTTDGNVRVTVEARARHTLLTVDNTGLPVPADQIDRLLRWRPTRLCRLPTPRRTRATRARHRRTRPTRAHRRVHTVNEPAGSAPTATMSWMDERSKRRRNPGVTAAPVDRDEPHCSFCGKARGDVDTMVCGPTPLTAICNECVALCTEIMTEQRDGADAR